MAETQVDNVDFKLISLNVRGIRDLSKRKAIFSWIRKQKADITFLQETYSILIIGNFNIKGKCFFRTGLITVKECYFSK